VCVCVLCVGKMRNMWNPHAATIAPATINTLQKIIVYTKLSIDYYSIKDMNLINCNLNEKVQIFNT